MQSNFVLVDLDDTIGATQVNMLDHMNTTYGTAYTYEGMTREHREKYDSPYGRYVGEILRQPDIMAKVQPFPGALEALTELRDNGYDVHIVSARKEPLHDCTLKWLNDHGFDKIISQVHPRPGRESGKSWKRRIAEEYKFVAAFDDTFDVCQELGYVEGLNVYMIDKPWNRGFDSELPPTVARVEDLSVGVQRFLAGQ